jgi:hypothetical protein
MKAFLERFCSGPVSLLAVDTFEQVWGALLDMIQERAARMAPRALTTTLWAMGSLRHPSKRHVSHAVAVHALAACPALNAQETANVAWGCAHLQVRNSAQMLR